MAGVRRWATIAGMSKRESLEADYVIVGAGSAGCVLANRLCKSGASVILLEAGGKDRNPMIHVPLGVAKLLHHPVVNWNYSSEPEERTGLRPIHWPRGKVLGGSSSINGMLYVRGNPADFDAWAADGCPGWTYDDVLPYFMRSERFEGGDDAYRGREGPMPVEGYRTILPITHRFVEAAREAGFGFNPDLNYSQMTRQGRWRGSTAATFLREVKGRSNLRIETHATAGQLTFDGRRCTGLSFFRDGSEHSVKANREVVLSAGAVNSPHLLQISGIGAPDHLGRIGVDVRHALNGVGYNLSDHYVSRVVHEVRDALTINDVGSGWRLGAAIAEFVLRAKGPLTFGVTSAQVFCHSSPGLAEPDLQLLFTPASYDPNVPLKRASTSGVSVAICPVHPQSRGSILATSANPLDRPEIRPNYLGNDADIEIMKAGINHARRIFAAEPLARHSMGERDPGPGYEGEDGMEAFIREKGATIYHPVGTCRMGQGPQAVVDERLRVHGIGNLRVADASIMPTLTTGNTNAPTIMIGEKAADLILSDNG